VLGRTGSNEEFGNFVREKVEERQTKRNGKEDTEN